jgi:hypothetical protein
MARIVIDLVRSRIKEKCFLEGGLCGSSTDVFDKFQVRMSATDGMP